MRSSYSALLYDFHPFLFFLVTACLVVGVQLSCFVLGVPPSCLVVGVPPCTECMHEVNPS